MAGGPETIVKCKCHHCGSKLWCWDFTADCGGDNISLCIKCLMDIIEKIRNQYCDEE